MQKFKRKMLHYIFCIAAVLCLFTGSAFAEEYDPLSAGADLAGQILETNLDLVQTVTENTMGLAGDVVSSALSDSNPLSLGSLTSLATDAISNFMDLNNQILTGLTDSAQNVTGGGMIALEDLAETNQNLAENVVSGLSDAASQALSGVTDAASLGQDTVSQMVSGASDLASLGQDTVSQMVSGASDLASSALSDTSLLSAAGDLTSTSVSSAADLVSTLTNTGLSLMNDLTGAASGNLADLLQNGSGGVLDLVSTLARTNADLLSALLGQGTQTAADLIPALTELTPELDTSLLPELAGTVSDLASDTLGTLTESALPTSAVSLLSDGISQTVDTVSEVSEQVLESAGSGMSSAGDLLSGLVSGGLSLGTLPSGSGVLEDLLEGIQALAENAVKAAGETDATKDLVSSDFASELAGLLSSGTADAVSSAREIGTSAMEGLEELTTPLTSSGRETVSSGLPGLLTNNPLTNLISGFSDGFGQALVNTDDLVSSGTDPLSGLTGLLGLLGTGLSSEASSPETVNTALSAEPVSGEATLTAVPLTTQSVQNTEPDLLSSLTQDLLGAVMLPGNLLAAGLGQVLGTLAGIPAGAAAGALLLPADKVLAVHDAVRNAAITAPLAAIPGALYGLATGSLLDAGTGAVTNSLIDGLFGNLLGAGLGTVLDAETGAAIGTLMGAVPGALLGGLPGAVLGGLAGEHVGRHLAGLATLALLPGKWIGAALSAPLGLLPGAVTGGLLNPGKWLGILPGAVTGAALGLPLVLGTQLLGRVLSTAAAIPLGFLTSEAVNIPLGTLINPFKWINLAGTNLLGIVPASVAAFLAQYAWGAFWLTAGGVIQPVIGFLANPILWPLLPICIPVLAVLCPWTVGVNLLAWSIEHPLTYFLGPVARTAISAITGIIIGMADAAFFHIVAGGIAGIVYGGLIGAALGLPFLLFGGPIWGALIGAGNGFVIGEIVQFWMWLFIGTWSGALVGGVGAGIINSVTGYWPVGFLLAEGMLLPLEIANFLLGTGVDAFLGGAAGFFLSPLFMLGYKLLGNLLTDGVSLLQELFTTASGAVLGFLAGLGLDALTGAGIGALLAAIPGFLAGSALDYTVGAIPGHLIGLLLGAGTGGLLGALLGGLAGGFGGNLLGRPLGAVLLPAKWVLGRIGRHLGYLIGAIPGAIKGLFFGPFKWIKAIVDGGLTGLAGAGVGALTGLIGGFFIGEGLDALTGSALGALGGGLLGSGLGFAGGSLLDLLISHLINGLSDTAAAADAETMPIPEIVSEVKDPIAQKAAGAEDALKNVFAAPAVVNGNHTALSSVPQTGDDSGVAVNLLLMLLSLFGMGITVKKVRAETM